MGEKKSKEVFWFGSVDIENYKKVTGEIIEHHQDEPEREITLYVTSDGGEATLALGFYDLVRIEKIPLTGVALGKVSSAGLIVFLAAEKRLASSNCIFMMHPNEHRPSPGRHFSYSRKDIPWMKNRVEVIDNKIKSIITGKTRMNQSQIREFIESQKYFTADEAQQMGLIDEII